MTSADIGSKSWPVARQPLACHLRPKLQTDSPDGGARLGAKGHVPASKRLRTDSGGDAPHQPLSPVFHPSARNLLAQTSAGAITRKTPNPHRAIKYMGIASPVNPFFNNKMCTVFTLRRSGRPVSLHRATCHGQLDKLLKSPHRASSICRILLGFRKSRPYYDCSARGMPLRARRPRPSVAALQRRRSERSVRRIAKETLHDSHQDRSGVDPGFGTGRGL